MYLKQYPTLVGYTALFCWALAAPLTVKIRSLPSFQILTTLFVVSFMVSATKITLCNKWSKLKQPFLFSLIGFVGIYGNDVLYISAFKHAPASHADLINYLWPVFTLLMTGFLPEEHLEPRHIIAAMLGFMGIFVLISQNQMGIQREYLFGYFLAFMDAIVWSVYTVAAKRYGKTPVDMIGIYCGVGALCSFLLHYRYEQFIYPSGEQWFVLVFLGITTQCLAYLFWDFGIKKGDIKLLTILSYSNPILSIAFLIAFGMAEPSKPLFIATILVSLGGLIGWSKPIFIKKRIRYT